MTQTKYDLDDQTQTLVAIYMHAIDMYCMCMRMYLSAKYIYCVGQILWCTYIHTVCVVHLADIKFGDLGANRGWLTFSLANKLSS